MEKDINKEEFLNSISPDKTLLDFYATWCGPCKMLSLVLEKIEKEQIINIEKIDVDESKKLASEFKIYSVPTLILVENNKEVKRISGFMSEEELKGWINDER